jgi:hypothetical protein
VPDHGPQQPQDAIRVDAGGVHGEREHHDDDPKGQHPALGEGLGRDVELADNRQLPAPYQHGLAALGGDPVHSDDQEGQPRSPASGCRERPAGAGGGANDRHPGAGAGEHDRIREQEGDHDERAQEGARRGRPGVPQRPRAANVCERRRRGRHRQ